jgi:hypothetical protein
LPIERRFGSAVAAICCAVAATMACGRPGNTALAAMCLAAPASSPSAATGLPWQWSRTQAAKSGMGSVMRRSGGMPVGNTVPLRPNNVPAPVPPLTF